MKEAPFTLNTFLIWLVSGGATVIARLVAARIPVLQREFSEAERGAITMLFSVILITGAFLGAVQAGYVPMPESELGWFEALFVPIATAIGVPALMTGAMQVKEERYNKKEGAVYASSYPKHDRLLGIRW
jgi:hypothetical protein